MHLHLGDPKAGPGHGLRQAFDRGEQQGLPFLLGHGLPGLGHRLPIRYCLQVGIDLAKDLGHLVATLLDRVQGDHAAASEHPSPRRPARRAGPGHWRVRERSGSGQVSAVRSSITRSMARIRSFKLTTDGERPGPIAEVLADRSQDAGHRIGAELGAPLWIESVDGPQQADRAGLDQVVHRLATSGELGCHGMHQAQVRGDEILANAPLLYSPPQPGPRATDAPAPPARPGHRPGRPAAHSPRCSPG
jgi:hypothetical protein